MHGLAWSLQQEQQPALPHSPFRLSQFYYVKGVAACLDGGPRQPWYIQTLAYFGKTKSHEIPIMIASYAFA
ncbi:hypothetical protein BDU57DRAFT_510064 [Ampelomyces quisqualis]|uniref:Uncharacterized protein n=1 Tax=Ampelomyces quisqualis TaxID=50730 RepID=A0A6A5R2W0_AMPQU|nr:hypothetical protein BDU57DRAFT_510064 [Ampelomyces quisqualis]